MEMATHQTFMPSAFTSPPGEHKACKFSIKLGTWNVRTLNESESGLSRGAQLAQELDKYGVDMCCISEVKWPGCGIRTIGNWLLAYSGSSQGLKRHGVGVMMKASLKDKLLDVQFVSDRLMVAVFGLGKLKLHLVSAYAPTEDKDGQEKDSFYLNLQKIPDAVPCRDKLIIAGDFNAQLGGQDRNAWSGALGKFYLGSKCTENGSALLGFCAANNLVVRNTFFQQKDIHLATWVGPAGHLANQIDHILIRRYDAKHICNCRVFRGTAFESDHHLMRAECRFPGKFKLPKESKTRVKINWKLLDDRKIKRAFNQQIQQAWTSLDPGCHRSWDNFKACVQSSQRQHLSEVQHQNQAETWISTATKQLIRLKQMAWIEYVNMKKMERAPMAKEMRPCGKEISQDPHSQGHRGKKMNNAKKGPPCENRNDLSPKKTLDLEGAKQAYRAANNKARTAVRNDKRRHWTQAAAKLEGLFRCGKLHEAYKEVHMRTDAIAHRKSLPEQMRVAQGELVIGEAENADLKRKYFSELLNVCRPTCPDLSCISSSEDSNVVDDSAPSFDETMGVIERLKNHKASGICGIAAESLKYGGMGIKKWLHDIIVQAWISEKAPEDWKKSLIVPVFKSGDTTILDNYRGISLLSVPSKVYSMLIGERLQEWVDSQLLDVQCGFRSDRGCNDAIFGLRRLHEEAMRKGQAVFTSFIDLSKAYDSIDRKLAWQIFEMRGVPRKLIALLKDLHEDTMCALRGDHFNTNNWFEVKTGFKQGDVNAPMLFNLFIDTVVRCLQPVLRSSGVKFMYHIDGHLRECTSRKLEDIAWVLMYADDIALVTESEADMQAALELVDRTFSQWGLQLSVKKTQVMRLGTDPQEGSIQIESGNIVYVDRFKYLGSISSQDLSMQTELTSRVTKAGQAFHKLIKLWKDKQLAKTVKLSVYKAIVLATLLYGCETWATPQVLIKPLDSFHMRCVRRICGLSLLQRKRNDDILKMCKMETVDTLVRFRRLRWLGHVARMDKSRLPKQLLFSQMQKVGHEGRSIKPWTHYARDDLNKVGLSYDWYRIAQKRALWRVKIQTLLVHI